MVDGNSHKQSTIELIGSLARSGFHNYLSAILPEIKSTEIGLLGAVGAGDGNAAARHIREKDSCGNVGSDCSKQNPQRKRFHADLSRRLR